MFPIPSDVWCICILLSLMDFSKALAQQSPLIIAQENISKQHFNRAIRIINRELESDSARVDPQYWFELQLGLGNAFEGKGEAYIADSIYKRLSAFIPNSDQETRLKMSIASNYLNLGKYPESEILAKELFDEGHFSPELFKVLGSNAHFLKRNQEAQFYLTESLKGLGTPADSMDAAAYLQTLQLLIASKIQDSLAETARSDVALSLRISNLHFGNFSISKAHNFQAVGAWNVYIQNYSVASSYLDSARKIFEKAKLKKLDYVNTILYQAYVQRIIGNYTKSEELFSEAFGVIKQKELVRNPRYATWISRYLVLKIASGDLDGAENLIAAAKDNYVNQINNYFPHLSESEKQIFYEDVRWRFEVFNSFASLRYRENPNIISMMYDNQITSKAILLNESSKWKQRILASGDLQLISKFLEWQSKKELLGKYIKIGNNNNTEVLELRASVNTLEKELLKRSDNFSNVIQHKSYDWKDVQRHLSSSEAVVEVIRFRWFDFKSNTFSDSLTYAALVLTKSSKDHPEIVFIPNSKKLETRALSYYRNALKFGKLDTLSFNNFWAPFDSLLQDIETVYLSPDGVYSFLNANTFYNTKLSEYIIDSKQVINVTNSKDLLSNKPLPSSNFAILLGNPAFYEAGETGFLDPLPGTSKEINNISTLLKQSGWESEAYLETRATEGNLRKIYRPDILHIATHGYFNSDIESNPLFNSGIYLSGSGSVLKAGDSLSLSAEDGILSAYEAMNLNIESSKLVVLSACETGLGVYKNGEGIYGLQRAFKIAGAQNLVMSLWQVDDTATMEMMVSFYTYLTSGVEISEAFRNAQLDQKQKRSSPYFWGAFILIGHQ